MIRRLAGRPSKKESEKVIKKNTSYSPENYNYIMQILKEREWEIQGSFSKVVNELISDHRQVKKYKEIEAAKLKEKLDVLER